LAASDKATGRPTPFISAERRSGDPAILIADISKVKAELGWAPVRNVNEMVTDTYNSIKK
jgi:UDP-glucose 4-epimerase